MGNYYYEFAISHGNGEEQYYKHYAKEGIEEKDLNDLELKLMDELEVDSCLYVGEGRDNQ